MKEIKLAFRQLARQKFYNAISILGFSLSISACLLILIYVLGQTNYDNFHVNKSKIYRVVTDQYATSPAILGPTVQEELPEVKVATRIRSPYINILIKAGNDLYTEPALSFRYVDINFFKLFSFKLLKGSEDGLVDSEEKVVITASTAAKYFGDDEPVGKIITVENFIPGFSTNTFTVTGVVEDPPANSHFKFKILASVRLFEAIGERPLDNWRMNWMWTYFQLDEHADPKAVETKIASIVARHVDEPPLYKLQPLEDIYLKSARLRAPIDEVGNINNVVAFAAIGMLVLLAAVANFVNLSIAGSIKRAKEVGVKKVLGGSAQGIARKFFIEALLTTSLSGFIALLLTLALENYTTFATDFGLRIEYQQLPYLFALLMVVVVTSALLASFFPSSILTRLKITEVVNGKFGTKQKGKLTQHFLIVFQFLVSIFILTAILVIDKQLDMVRNKSLGFRKDQVIIVPCEIELREKLPTLKSELLGSALISGVGASSRPPGFGGIWSQVYRMEGIPFNDDEYVDIGTYHVGPDFIATMEIEVVMGRAFSSAIASDSAAFVINESGLAELVKWGGEEWQNPLGRIIEVAPGRSRPNVYKRGPIIGVVKDFHFNSLFEQIGPLALTINYTPLKTLAIKVAGNDPQSAISFIERKWKDLNIEWPFEYSFLDQGYITLYENELQTKDLLQIFGFIAMVLSCLGLWGLVIVLTEQKRKEISVRKLLGSPLSQLVLLLVRRYVFLIILAFIISLPFTWYIMTNWLSDFAYKVRIDSFTILTPLGLCIFGAVVTISYVCIKAAMSNPIKYLRNE